MQGYHSQLWLFDSAVLHGGAPFRGKESTEHEVAAYPMLLPDGVFDCWGVGEFWWGLLASALRSDDVADGLHDVPGDLLLSTLACEFFQGLCSGGHA